MKREDPTYVLLNGQKPVLTESGFGTIKTTVGQTARLFFVNGGPGSCGVLETNFPGSETLKLVDHAFSRVLRKGVLGEIKGEGLVSAQDLRSRSLLGVNAPPCAHSAPSIILPTS